MLNILWDTRGYFFWLLVISLGCLVAERIRPWRKEQKLLRPQFAQDLFWLVWNGHFVGIAAASLGAAAIAWILRDPGQSLLDRAEAVHALAAWPLWAQVVVFFVAKDFMDWCIHNLLHRVPALWTFHKVHHSILAMDWIGNFRFHWMEVLVYRGLTYLPLLLLGVDGRVVLWVAILSTVIGHLNHANLNITWGPLRYLINSPRMHIWHHALEWPQEHPAGVNFGISLSLWDWLAGTVWWPGVDEAPTQQPPALGFRHIDEFPRSLVPRFLIPLPQFVAAARSRRGGPHATS